jgi:hypothetical protein
MECLLSFGAESFVFQFAIQKYKYLYILNINIKIYRTIILLLFFMGVELGRSR